MKLIVNSFMEQQMNRLITNSQLQVIQPNFLFPYCFIGSLDNKRSGSSTKYQGTRF